MHVVVVENILKNHSSQVVYNSRPQAYDTEPLDQEKRPGKITRQKYIISFYCHWYHNLSRKFSGFPTGVELQLFNTWNYTPSGTYWWRNCLVTIYFTDFHNLPLLLYVTTLNFFRCILSTAFVPCHDSKLRPMYVMTLKCVYRVSSL